MYRAIEEIKERLKRANIDVENSESPMDLDEHRGLLLKVNKVHVNRRVN